ncbi:interferon-induced transmembrane protein 2-like [Ranitomeya variabilis]|uniref:interferon-induced transmembrane protein 2-like n=1 Tax=Ranitomeya variabilis TaxID=490064 RepID=UPI0040571096
MEDDSKLRDPDFQESAPSKTYPTQEPPPPYAQGVAAPAYQEPYYPKQYAAVPQQPMVYQPAQHVVTVGTTPPVVGAPLQLTYSDYMVWSIVNIFCCCLPLGVAALIYSCKTQDAITRNDLYSARSHSSMARGLNIASMIFGIFVYIFIIVYMVVIQQQFYNSYKSSTSYNGY